LENRYHFFSLWIVFSFVIPSFYVNPARSFGSAIFMGYTALSHLWMLWVASIIGGIIGALIMEIFIYKKLIIVI